MKIKTLVKSIDALFVTKDQSIYKQESGITVTTSREIRRIGYCVSLTHERVKEAVEQDIDLLITHHPAWDFMPRMQEACEETLRQYNIGHYFNHLPLDDAEFGTNQTLAESLGFDKIIKGYTYEGLACGRYGFYDEPIDFNTLVKRMEGVLKEPVKAHMFHSRPIKKVGIVCGGGEGVSLIETSIDTHCDVYITGEKNLYTLQYAEFLEMNLIIGSHTFIERPGLEGLAKKIKQVYPQVTLVPLKEPHME